MYIRSLSAGGKPPPPILPEKPVRDGLDGLLVAHLGVSARPYRSHIIDILRVIDSVPTGRQLLDELQQLARDGHVPLVYCRTEADADTPGAQGQSPVQPSMATQPDGPSTRVWRLDPEMLLQISRTISGVREHAPVIFAGLIAVRNHLQRSAGGAAPSSPQAQWCDSLRRELQAAMPSTVADSSATPTAAPARRASLSSDSAMATSAPAPDGASSLRASARRFAISSPRTATGRAASFSAGSLVAASSARKSSRAASFTATSPATVLDMESLQRADGAAILPFPSLAGVRAGGSDPVEPLPTPAGATGNPALARSPIADASDVGEAGEQAKETPKRGWASRLSRWASKRFQRARATLVGLPHDGVTRAGDTGQSSSLSPAQPRHGHRRSPSSVAAALRQTPLHLSPAGLPEPAPARLGSRNGNGNANSASTGLDDELQN